MARTPDSGGGIVWTNLNFYNSMLNDHPLVEKRKLSLEKKRQSIVPFVNLADETTSTAETSTLPFDIPFFMNQHEKELCKGKQNKVLSHTSYRRNIVYRTRAIISRGLYIFYPIFHCGLYCRTVSNTDNLCAKNGNS